MTFTESDAKNDGLIKREVGREMAKVAQTQNPELYEHFCRVCENVGRDPSDVFGEMAVRSLNDEGYAKRILSSEVNMATLKSDEIRLEDVKYVKKLSDELGMGDSDEKNDPIERLIEKRLESVTQSPIDNFRHSKQGGSVPDDQVVRHMESLQNKIDELEQKLEDGESEQQPSGESSGESEQSVDDLFSEDSGGDAEEEVEEEDEGSDIFDRDDGQQEEEELDIDYEDEQDKDQEEEAIFASAGSSAGDADADEGEEDISEIFTSEDGEEE